MRRKRSRAVCINHDRSLRETSNPLRRMSRRLRTVLAVKIWRFASGASCRGWAHKRKKDRFTYPQMTIGQETQTDAALGGSGSHSALMATIDACWCSQVSQGKRRCG